MTQNSKIRRRGREIALVLLAVALSALLLACTESECQQCGGYLNQKNHNAMPCGHHYYCTVEAEREHTIRCPICSWYLCSGTHGAGICGETEPETTGGILTAMSRCPGCKEIVDAPDSHDAQCGTEGHYSCDGADHAPARCRLHYACDGAEHGAAPCGMHTACEEGNHSVYSCGRHYACREEGEHGLLPCGHYACREEGEHGLLPCGHYACEEGDHALADCVIHYNCMDGNHKAADCGIKGHFACMGSHALADCGIIGHYECDGKPHGDAACGIDGHFACSGSHNQQACGHSPCDPDYGTTVHDVMNCGVHYHCQGIVSGDHEVCGHCGKPMCTNQETHGFYPCGFGNHYYCNGYDVAAGVPVGSYDHQLFACDEHSDCTALEIPGTPTDPNLHYDCQECSYCVARGHAPGCSQNTDPAQ